MKFLLTCEHGGNKIPSAYKEDFIKAASTLKTHRGYDPGALNLFQFLKPLADFSLSQEISRLLVELNRSLTHPQLFSEFSENMSKEKKKDILEMYYFPFRNEVEKFIKEVLEKDGKILHISVHTFTPELHGVIRNADIGLLYDPANRAEKDFCKALKAIVRQEAPFLRLRYNYPYLGRADGFTTYLRKRFPEGYNGIELEVNQKFVINSEFPEPLKQIIYRGIMTLLKSQQQ